MSKYLIEFKSSGTKALFEYNKNGILVKFELNPPEEFTPEQEKVFIEMLPKTEPQIVRWKQSKNPNIIFSVVVDDLSFDNFYNTYNYKVSKRSVAENAWKRLPDTEKAKALRYIYQYERFLSETKVSKKYPETYLNSGIWNN